MSPRHGRGRKVCRHSDDCEDAAPASKGAFDMATIQVGSVATDDPFLEGIDMIGVSTNITDLKAAVDA